MGEVTGLPVSAGWMAGVRHKAAGRLEPFMDHVRAQPRQAGVIYADETPRTAGHLEYVHVACTGYLTAMHTGSRSAAGIDAGGVLDGYGGVQPVRKSGTPTASTSSASLTPGRLMICRTASITRSGRNGGLVPSR